MTSSPNSSSTSLPSGILRSQAYRDWLGISASVLCAIHCAAMPFVVSFLPMIGLSFLSEPSFHRWMVWICLALALLAFVPGWRRHHRLPPSLIGLVGLSLISTAAFYGPEECCPSGCTAPTDDSPSSAVVYSPNDRTAEIPSTSSGLLFSPLRPIESNAKEECESSCCPSESVSEPTTPPVIIADSNLSSNDSCGTDSGTDTCCPTNEPTAAIAQAGMSSLAWTLMTPLGGLILVVAHIFNHLFSCRCKAPCCPHSSCHSEEL